MVRGSFLTRTIASGILGAAARCVGVLARLRRDAAEADVHWVRDADDGLYVPQHFQHQSEPGRRSPNSMLGYGIFWLTSGDPIPHSARTSRSTTAAASTPKWRDITFTIAGLEYTYPGANDIDYFELKTGGVWAKGPWSLGLNNYWSPNNFGLDTSRMRIEGSVGYTFHREALEFLHAQHQRRRSDTSRTKRPMSSPNYTYWNAGLTLGFLEHWSADIRYYDTDYNQDQCFINSGGRNNCDARAVGTIKATF